MHSELTTDLSIIYSNLSKSKSNRENVVLIKTGALNPVHRSHIANLIKVKQYLENIYNLNVVAAYISPTHDQYVQRKLGEHLIPSQHRIEMCQRAIEEENQQHWLAVDKAEAFAPTFITLKNVTLSLQTYLNEQIHLDKPIRVIYVAGLDLFNRCNGMHSLRDKHMGGVAVVYRIGQDSALIESLIKQNPLKLYFIPLDDDTNQSIDISSTLIRTNLQNNQDCSHLTYLSVLQYLQFISNQK